MADATRQVVVQLGRNFGEWVPNHSLPNRLLGGAVGLQGSLQSLYSKDEPLRSDLASRVPLSPALSAHFSTGNCPLGTSQSKASKLKAGEKVGVCL